MASERAQKRLSAVLAADVVGYSRHIGEDEAGTISALQALHRDLIVPTVDAHGGQIVKRMGDGYLVEFKSSSDAINSAVAWQSGIIAQEQAGQGGPDIQFRIGINLGDIVSHDDDIYGDGVNVAARLARLSPDPAFDGCSG